MYSITHSEYYIKQQTVPVYVNTSIYSIQAQNLSVS